MGLGQLLAQASDGGHEPQLLELRRVQFGRQVMNGGRQSFDPILNLLYPSGELNAGFRRPLAEEVQVHRQEG